jgi:hypothetical protein
MYENFSSLSVFATGHRKHKKIQQINKLASDYGVDLITGCETWTDWRFVTNEESKFPNLFGNGLPSWGSCAFNLQDGKIKRDQWGGTCISAIGRFSSFVTGVGNDPSGLGWWAWLRVARGGSKLTLLRPINPVAREKGQWVKPSGTNIPDTLRPAGKFGIQG